MFIYIHKALLLLTSMNPVNCAVFSLTKSFKKLHENVNIWTIM